MSVLSTAPLNMPTASTCPPSTPRLPKPPYDDAAGDGRERLRLHDPVGDEILRQRRLVGIEHPLRRDARHDGEVGV